MTKSKNQPKQATANPPVEKIETKPIESGLVPDLDVRPDYALVNGVYHRIVKAVGYPRRVEDGWLEAFLSVSEPYDISLHVHPAPINSTLVLLHNQLIKQTSDLLSSTAKGTPNPSLEIKHGDTMRVYELLYKGEEKLFQVSLYVDNQADSLQELDLLTEKCNANMNSILVMPKVVNYRMSDGLKSMLPQSKDALATRREFLTSSLSATFPFLYPVASEKNGVFFAHEKNTLNPVFIDFDSMSNKHFFVLGISGSGKSYASKYLVMQQLFTQNAKVFIIDPNAEYTKLTKEMGGSVISLSKDSPTMINLFDMAGEDFGSKMLTLISVFDIITGGLTESQKGVLNGALIEVYKKRNIEAHKPATWKKKPPTFSDLKKVLQKSWKNMRRRTGSLEDKSVEVLLNRVKMYSKGGFFEFLDKRTRINLSKGFVNFDLSNLPAQVRQLVMFSVLELVSREIRKDKKPKIVLIDEGWSLLRSKEAENYILEFIKTSRKFNASIGFITQEIEDLLRSDGGKSILNTTSTKILLRQNSSNLALIGKTLALNEKEQNYLLRADKGNGLLITEKGRYEFVIHAPPKIDSLITTDPNADKKKKQRKSKEEKEKVSIDASKGFYLKDDINEEEKHYLKQEGYVQHDSHGFSSGGEYWFYVKTEGNETKEHALMRWMVKAELEKHDIKAETLSTVGADVSAEVNGKRIFFEIETGNVLESRGEDYFKQKMETLAAKCDKLIVLVTNRGLKPKYKTLLDAQVITRTEVEETVNELVGKNKASTAHNSL